jgi:chromosome segregation ATPase
VEAELSLRESKGVVEELKRQLALAKAKEEGTSVTLNCLGEAEAEAEVLRQELEFLKDIVFEMNELKEELSRSKGALEAAKAESLLIEQGYIGFLEDTKEALFGAEREVKELKTALAEANKRREEIENELKELKRSPQAEQGHIGFQDDAKAALFNTEREVGELKTSLNEANERKEEVKREMKDSKECHQAVLEVMKVPRCNDERCEEMEQQVLARGAALKEMKEQLAESEAKRCTLQQKLDLAEARLQELELKFADAAPFEEAGSKKGSSVEASNEGVNKNIAVQQHQNRIYL